MERKKIEKKIGDEFYADLDYTYGDEPEDVDTVIEFINEAKKNGATHLKFFGGVSELSFECYCMNIQPISILEESDEEFEARKEEEEQKELKRQEEVEKRQRAFYEELKKKYEEP